MIEETRPNYVWLWIGANTTGKTPTAIKRAIKYKLSRPNQKVVSFDPRKKIREIKVYNPLTKRDQPLVDRIIEEWDLNWADDLLGTDKHGKIVKEPLKNYLLVLDDYHMLCKNYKTPQGLRNLMAMRVEYNIDIIGITHTPKFILEGIADYVTDYSIFYNLATETSFEKKIQNYEKCQKAAIVINEYVCKYDKEIKYPKFPYIHINNKTGNVRYFNMPLEKLKQLNCFKKLKTV